MQTMSGNNETNTVKLPWWAPFAKAVAAAIIGFVVAFLTALLPFVDTGKPVSVTGWIIATLAALVSLGASFGAVYAIPNRPTNTGVAQTNPAYVVTDSMHVGQ